MTSAADQISAVVIGPKAQGRNYGVRRFAGARPSSEAQARLNDFAMSLTGWAILRLERMAAMFPLTADEQCFAVVRARRMGEAELGPVAIAHLLIVPRAVLEAVDWASTRLLQAIPDPGEAAFGELPPVVDPRATVAGPKLEGVPQAAWTDLTIDANGADPEAVLCALMEAVSPIEQRARLTGWATTSLLAKAGGLDPARLFKLVVHAPAESVAAFEDTHERLVLDKAAVPAAAPLVWKAWTRLAAIARAEPDAAPLRAARWTPDKAKASAETVMFGEIALACAELSPVQMTALLRAVARNATGGDPVSRALRDGVAETFNAITEVADAEGVAFYVQTLLDQASPQEMAALPGMNDAIARPDVAGWLGERLDRLDAPDIARRWSRRLAVDDAFGDGLALAAPAIQEAVLDAVLCDLRDAGRRKLAARLLRLHCARSARAAIVRRALEALLAEPASALDVALADRFVLEAAERHAPHLMSPLTERAVLPAMRLARDKESLYRAARALLSAEGRRSVR